MMELAGQEVSLEIIEPDEDNGTNRVEKRSVQLTHNYVSIRLLLQFLEFRKHTHQ